MTEGKRFTGQVTPSIVDTEYRNCNFSQPAPVDGTGEAAGRMRGVRLFPGDDTPRTFIDCNLLNCEVPPGSTVIGGLTAVVERITTAELVNVDGLELRGESVSHRVHGKWTAVGYVDRHKPETVELK